MARRSFARIVAALILGLGLTLGLVWLLNSPGRGLAAPLDAEAPVATEGRAPDAVHTVCPAGPPACDHAVIQEAVDAAGEGDLIKVATAVYTGVHGRPAPAGYNGPSIITQVVYISKSLTLEGGYTTTDWAVQNPISYPTTLDAQGQGRVILITGTISVTLDGFRITGGDATELGGLGYGWDSGGGLYIGRATVAVSDSMVFSNTTGSGSASGGGVYADHVGRFVFQNNAVLSNTISGHTSLGAGLAIDTGDHLLIVGNRFVGNRGRLANPPPDFPPPGAGGLVVQGPCTNAVIRHNEISGNYVDGEWGGLVVYCDQVTISDNVISNNTAATVGGLGITSSNGVTITDNLILGNHAGLDPDDMAEGAGAAVWYSRDVTLTNNTIAGNRLGDGGVGGGVFVLASDCDFRHNTIAQNSGGDGSGIHIANWDSPDSTVSLTNTILVSQTVGITVAAGSTATMEATLWGSGAWANGTDWDGAGIILTGTVNVWGDPAFVDPESGDYHIALGSAAMDAGVDAGVLVDMDGEPRPAGMGYDIGADEVQALVRYVATDGADSGDCSTPAGRCLTVQYAVDQAGEGDEVRVASGVYTGVHGRPAPAGYSDPSIITQVVHISKSITVRGGYTTTDWTTSNPISYPTTLDAEWQGRVLVISGTITTTIEGLRLTRGDAAGLGGVREYYDLGGGVCVMTATAVVNDSWILNNRADFGGGLGLLGSHARVSGNAFTSNTVGYEGGGLYAEGGDLLLDGNTFITNTAGWDGGGLFVYQTDTSLTGSTFVENRADMWGGGVGAYECPEITLDGNQVVSNTALQGGGLLMSVISATLRGNLISANYGEIGDGGLQVGGEQVTLDGNLIVGNSTDERNGGLSLGADNATLRNNVIADNTALIAGGGLVFFDVGYPPVTRRVDLIHNTIARNRAGDGSGILLVDWGEGDVTVTMTNTVLVSHSVGISVSAGNTVTLQGTLWGSGAWANGVDWAGDGTILTGTVNAWGAPVFVDPDSGDYHIGPGSAAIDAGVDAGVSVDMDGEFRPAGMGYDIGADEYAAGPTMLYLPLILR